VDNRQYPTLAWQFIVDIQDTHGKDRDTERMKKILAHFTDFNHRPERRKADTFGALGYYRTFKPAKQMQKYDVEIVGTGIDKYGSDFLGNWSNIFKKYDIVWIMHHFGEHNAAAQSFMRDRYKKKLVYDLDDNYLDVPESNPTYETFKKTKRSRAILSTMFFFADALTVSTEPLKERLDKHFYDVHGIKKPIFIIPNMNDIKDWQYTPVAKHTDKIIIGYAGSNSHKEDINLVLPVIDKLMKKYPTLELHIAGVIDKTQLGEYFSTFTKKHLERVAMLPVTPTFWEYPKYLSEMQWDIGIAPLVDTPFTRSKSHIKWMEYGSYEIPTVASRVYPYFMDLCGRDTIVDGETGFLCRTQDEWYSKLERLILDKGLRQRIGRQAYEAIVRDWQYSSFDVDAVFDKIAQLRPI